MIFLKLWASFLVVLFVIAIGAIVMATTTSNFHGLADRIAMIIWPVLIACYVLSVAVVVLYVLWVD